MRLADQWDAIESELPPGWVDAHVRVRVSDPAAAERAAFLLAPLNPLRRESRVDVHVTPASRVQLRWLLGRLAKERIEGDLELLHTERAATAAAVADAPAPAVARSLAAQWDAEADALPADWSDLVVLVELDSSDLLARATLAMSPCNPARVGLRLLRFRAAQRRGYGVSPQMARACLAKLDAEGIRGRLEIAIALSDADPVGTQGPVFYIEGQVV